MIQENIKYPYDATFEGTKNRQRDIKRACSVCGGFGKVPQWKLGKDKLPHFAGFIPCKVCDNSGEV